MAIKRLVLTCDWCSHESDDYEDPTEAEALDSGWFVVQGPDVILGTHEKVYCSLDCLRADL